MNFYNQYPEMRPYKGAHFGEADVPALLLIGESHYLIDDSMQHESAEHWYAGNSTTLSLIERKMIRTEEIVTKGRDEGFQNAIWVNSFSEINESGPRFSDYKRVVDYIAFYNFFLSSQRTHPLAPTMAVVFPAGNVTLSLRNTGSCGRVG